jgi:hypothetical protein
VSDDRLDGVPSAGAERYRVGRHGGGDCVYFQIGDQPSKNDPRICVAFPRLDSTGDVVLFSAAVVAADIAEALNRDLTIST